MRDRLHLGELIAQAIDEACYRKKENCTGDGDRHQPGERQTNWSRFPPVRNIVPPWLAVSLPRKEPPP